MLLLEDDSNEIKADRVALDLMISETNAKHKKDKEDLKTREAELNLKEKALDKRDKSQDKRDLKLDAIDKDLEDREICIGWQLEDIEMGEVNLRIKERKFLLKLKKHDLDSKK